jgi:hypothetical protein
MGAILVSVQLRIAAPAEVLIQKNVDVLHGWELAANTLATKPCLYTYLLPPRIGDPRSVLAIVLRHMLSLANRAGAHHFCRSPIGLTGPGLQKTQGLVSLSGSSIGIHGLAFLYLPVYTWLTERRVDDDFLETFDAAGGA